jgi:hypothetical protein
MAELEVWSKDGVKLGVINDEAETVEFTEEWERRKKRRRVKKEEPSGNPAAE